MHEYTSVVAAVIPGIRGYQCGSAKPFSIGLPSSFKVLGWHYIADKLVKQIHRYDGVMNGCNRKKGELSDSETMLVRASRPIMADMQHVSY